MKRSEAAMLQRALTAVDVANAEDPQTIRVRGEERPKELAHAELVSEWIERLVPAASDALRIAARAHHVRRWEIPRNSEPKGRAGYYRWRKKLQAHHASVTREILEAEGFDEETIARVEALVRKRGLGSDPDVQALEDALCLVFLETQLEAFSEQLADEPHTLDVIRKTARKMSDAARAYAGTLPLSPTARALLERALGD